MLAAAILAAGFAGSAQADDVVGTDVVSSDFSAEVDTTYVPEYAETADEVEAANLNRVVAWFSYPNSWGNDVPLRYGTSTWGYRRIVHDYGYNRGCIQTTITWGTKVRHSATSDLYTRYFNFSRRGDWTPSWYKVIVERNSNRGVIVAYNNLNLSHCTG